MPRKWSEVRERGIRQKTLRTLCRLNEQMANHPTLGLLEAIIEATGWQKRKAYDYTKALILFRRTEAVRRMKASTPELAQVVTMDKPTFKRALRSFGSEFRQMLEEALGQSRESEKMLEGISPPPSIGFDNVTDMPFMKRAHIRVMSLKCPYGKKEVSYIPCPKRFLEEEEEKEPPEVCDHATCPRMKYDLPLHEWTAKIRMTVPSDDLPRFLSGLTKEIRNTLKDVKQPAP